MYPSHIDGWGPRVGAKFGRRPAKCTLGVTSLPTKQTNPTETEVGQLQMTMLIDKEIIWLQITAAT
jgi:hypothetical protein